MVSSEVFSPRMISTKGMRCTGLKKCIPQKFSGRLSDCANRLIGIVDVFDVMTVSSPTCDSTSLSTAAFTFGFSTTASTITSEFSMPA
eukprot:TRINITY_DN14257_c0_g1_i1.p2 TRINITY_DN14257_c0_g1~~TRINITY_DN14257_c0_g1_i1.p2  ORF type:complete len:88 (-),score=2.39 TRINITY_DN14257_c0_g1_i1:186-449(-)